MLPGIGGGPAERLTQPKYLHKRRNNLSILGKWRRNVTCANLQIIFQRYKIIRSFQMAPKNLKGRQNKVAFERFDHDKFGESRMSPWGLQRYMKDLGWRPYGYSDWPTKLRGRWIRREGLQCASHGGKSTCLGRHPKLWIPGKTELTAFTSGEEIEPGLDTADRAGDAYPAPTLPSNGRYMLASLPPELLHQILGYLIPRGCAYQFLVGKRTNKPIQIVQQVVPANGNGLRSVHPALAATSRHWRDVVYGILYGQNSFVFNLGITTMEVGIGTHDFRKMESWVRILSDAPDSGSPLGPLTETVAAYLKSATLLFAYPVSTGTKEVNQIMSMVSRVTQMLGLTVFDELQIHIQPAQKTNKQYDTVYVDTLDVDFCEDTKRIKVQVRDSEIISPSRAQKVQRAFEPLVKLRAVGDVTISGLMTEDLARDLKDSITANKGPA